MRHTNIQTTLRYVHLDPDHLDIVVAKLDSALRTMDTQVDTSPQPSCAYPRISGLIMPLAEPIAT